MTEYQKMISGQLYDSEVAELAEARRRAVRLTRLYNHTELWSERTLLLKELLGTMGKNVYINPTFRCDYGNNIHIGNDFFANYDCIFLDIAPITIGNNVMLAPRVCLYTATHPIDSGVRNGTSGANKILEYGKAITLGNGVWIGGGAIINPGVTIGDNTVIGSGSVVTHDIPSNVVAAGNPCKVIRPITDDDKNYWEGLKKEYLASL